MSLTCTVVVLFGELAVGSRRLAVEKRIKQEWLGVAVVACVGWPSCEGTPTTNENSIVANKRKKSNLPVRHKLGYTLGSATMLAPGA